MSSRAKQEGTTENTSAIMSWGQPSQSPIKKKASKPKIPWPCAGGKATFISVSYYQVLVPLAVPSVGECQWGSAGECRRQVPPASWSSSCRWRWVWQPSSGPACLCASCSAAGEQLSYMSEVAGTWRNLCTRLCYPSMKTYLVFSIIHSTKQWWISQLASQPSSCLPFPFLSTHRAEGQGKVTSTFLNKLSLDMGTKTQHTFPEATSLF